MAQQISHLLSINDEMKKLGLRVFKNYKSDVENDTNLPENEIKSTSYLCDKWLEELKNN